MSAALSLKATEESRAKWSSRLNAMRGAGGRRARKGEPSASLRSLLAHLPKGAVVLDDTPPLTQETSK